MPETELILPIAAIFLLCLLVWQTGRIRARLVRIEARMAEFQGISAETDGEDAKAAEPSPGSAFEAFLAEDPSRSGLGKAEQFAAYREWRKERGLNWSKS